MTRRVRAGLAVAGVCAAATLAYLPSFWVPFQFDDYARLGDNYSLQHGGLVEALLWLGNSRVVPALTFILNYQLSGFEPLSYHVVNFAVHLLTTLGVFALALVLCLAPRLRPAWPPQRALVLATAAALLFACHPLQTQAVTYIIQRYASMAALFYVWAVVCYLQARLRQAGVEPGRPTPYFVGTAVCAVCAVLSKENAASLPAALLLTEWVGFGWPRRWRAIALGGAVMVLLVALPVAWKTVFWKPLASGAPPDAVPLLWRLQAAVFAPRSEIVGGRLPVREYLLTQLTVVPRYLALVVLPWGQNIDHDVPVARTLSAPVLASGAALVLLVGLAVWLVRRSPLAAFAVLWFFITLSVESSVLVLTDLMVEHRMYLPMVGVALAGGGVFAAAVERAPRLVTVAGAGVAAGLVALTFARNVVWLSPLTLWLDAAEKSPGKSRPHANAGVGYHQVERLDEAIEQYCLALKLEPDAEVAHDNLEIALEALGMLDDMPGKVVERAPDGSVTLEIDDIASYCP